MIRKVAKEKLNKKRKSLKEVFSQMGKNISSFVKGIFFFFKFSILLVFVFIFYLLKGGKKEDPDKPGHRIRINLNPIRNLYNKLYKRVILTFDTKKAHEVKASDLIFLAMKNLSYKKNRTYVTIIGMGIGFGAVILLLSLGFGFERLVISRVASLTEMKQIEVNTSQGSLLTFSPEFISKINTIDKVTTVIPIVTSVSKVTFNNAVSDVIVYGVGAKYFEQAGLSLIKGSFYGDGIPDISENSNEDKGGVVAGVSTVLISNKSYNQEIYKIKYSIFPLTWKPVYAKPEIGSQIIGYTKREVGPQDAVEVWGYKYSGSDSSRRGEDLNGKKYSPWISDAVPLWKKEPCLLTNLDCEGKEYVVVRSGEAQVIKNGYISEDLVSVERYEINSDSSLGVFSGKVIEDITFKIKSNNFTTIYLDPEIDARRSTILEMNNNYDFEGKLIYGGLYDSSNGHYIKSDSGDKYGYWIKAEMKLWSEKECKGVCEEYLTSPKDSSYKESKITLYLKTSDVNTGDTTPGSLLGQVLGISSSGTNGDSFIGIDSIKKENDGIDWVSISSELGTVDKVAKDVKPLPETAQKLAMVNTSMLNLLGINANDALGKKFDSTIIFDSKLFNRSNYLVESAPHLLKSTGLYLIRKPQHSIFRLRILVLLV
ncbi:ABC transporter permease [Candidatus Dojkabacteria bacterium]|jgi:hypothetical protein|nr:ABC transporter permease [Candidatus Dojkabacteria bacterium]